MKIDKHDTTLTEKAAIFDLKVWIRALQIWILYFVPMDPGERLFGEILRTLNGASLSIEGRVNTHRE